MLMNEMINIAENENTLFLAIDKNKMNFEVIEKIHSILSNKFNERLHIHEVEDEEQTEIESILNSMTDDDKRIVRTEKLSIQI